jgi:large subunit ribosomal protein L24e
MTSAASQYDLETWHRAQPAHSHPQPCPFPTAHSLTTVTLQEVAKKRTRRTVKHQRAIVGASLDVIKERRAQRPEARAAARSAAVQEGKEKRAAAESKKKAEKAKSASGAARGQAQKVSKQGAKGAAPKVQARTR